MSWTAQYAALARYNQWMNRKIFAVAARASDAQRKQDLGAFFGSIHNTLNHLLLADRVWLGRLYDPALALSYDAAGQVIPMTSLAQVLYDGFDELRQQREATDSALIAFSSQLDEPRLLAQVSYQNSAGKAFVEPLWQALGHVFNHETHHRGQVTTLLKQLGHDPGVTDLIAMYREEAS